MDDKRLFEVLCNSQESCHRKWAKRKGQKSCIINNLTNKEELKLIILILKTCYHQRKCNSQKCYGLHYIPDYLIAIDRWSSVEINTCSVGFITYI